MFSAIITNNNYCWLKINKLFVNIVFVIGRPKWWKYEANLELLKSPSRVVKGKDPPLEVKQLDMYAHLKFEKYF